MHVNEFNSMYGKLKDLKTYKLVYPHIIQHYYFDGPEVEVESDVHRNMREVKMRLNLDPASTH